MIDERNDEPGTDLLFRWINQAQQITCEKEQFQS